MNAVSVAVAATFWLIVVCPRHCLCFRSRCLPPPLPLLAADVIGDGGDCGNGCDRNGNSGNDRAFRSFSRVMFKILHIKSNILNIKLDEEGGGRRMDMATATRMRATMATTSSHDGGGRGDGGCSDSGIGDSFDVGSSGNDDSNNSGGCGNDDNNDGGGGHSKGGGHRQQSTQSGSERNGGDGNDYGNSDSNQLKAAVKETTTAVMAMVSATASATASAGGDTKTAATQRWWRRQHEDVGDGDGNGDGDNGNEGNKSAAAEGAGGRGQRFVAAPPVAMASAANSGNSGGRQRWP
jgi:hypothetical protein